MEALSALGHCSDEVDALLASMGGAVAPPASAGPAKASGSLASPAVEAQRFRSVAQLGSQFRDLTKSLLGGRKLGRHFEDWLWTQRHAEAREGLAADPVMPSGACASVSGSVELVQKLRAAGDVPEGRLEAIFDALARSCRAGISRIQQQQTKHHVLVKLSTIEVPATSAAGPSRAGKVVLSACGLRLEVHELHFGRLERRWRAEQGIPEARGLSGDGKRDFLRAAFCMLARYAAAGGASKGGCADQAACPNAVFDCLRAMGCEGECFASPVNARLPRYCSAFHDVDACFGSAGDYTALDFSKGGHFEANPPFVAAVVEDMFSTFTKELARADEYDVPLSFTVVLPAWQDAAHGEASEAAQERGRVLREMRASAYCAAELRLEANEHCYTIGAQHSSGRPRALAGGTWLAELRPAASATMVLWLQSAAGRRKWPITEDATERLRRAFAVGVESGAEPGAGLRVKRVTAQGSGASVGVASKRAGGAKGKGSEKGAGRAKRHKPA